MKASSVLIVIGVVAVVAGVAWFRSARQVPPAEALAPPSEATPSAVPETVPSPNSINAKPGRVSASPATGVEGGFPAGPANAPVTPLTEPAGGAQPAPAAPEPASGALAAQPAVAPEAAAAPKKLPRVVDLGADKCIPCKKMAPILVELRKEYEGRVIVDFIDVWKNPKAGEPYKIRVIPTQIFFDADGKEVWRHEGFLPKEEFVRKFAEMGVK